MLKRLRSFLFAVARRWGTFVTGGFLIGLVSLYQSTSHPVPPWVYWAIALVALFVAFFRVWNDQFEIAEAEKAQNLKPQIIGEVLYAKFIAFTSTRVKDGPEVPSASLLLKLGLTNRNSVDTTIKEVLLLVKNDGVLYECIRQEISRGFVVLYSDKYGNHQQVSPPSLIGNISYQNPIRYRMRSEGWLLFQVQGMADPRQSVSPDLTLTIIDELNDSHTIVVKSHLIQH